MDLEALKKDGVQFLTGVGLGTGATVLSLHAARRIPKYSGLVLLGAGAVGFMFGGKVLRTPSLIAASLGGVQLLNMLGNEGGVPAIAGWKGMVNKVVPQLNGVDGAAMAGLGDIEKLNEQLLGEGNGISELDELTGLGNMDVNLESTLIGLNVL